MWRTINLTETVVYDNLFDINQADGSYVATEKNQDGEDDNEVWLFKVNLGVAMIGQVRLGIWTSMRVNLFGNFFIVF
ncbi:MAG: hypothetical protein CM15mP64_4610 [Candidatus Neomarinimicrobiota bacterium]|nr:MAG: hypothetical protein CM15mP64_4610 [Candidatus Neomarinimicrobiota bacterium]